MNEKSKSNGDTALHIASRMGHVETIKVLMKESLASPVSLCGSYNVEARNNSGQTALDVAKDENVRNLLKTYMTESVISTMKFRMPSQDTTLANARHELCRVATQNNRRVAPFLFVLGGFDGGILIRPQQEHDFTLEQVAGIEGFVRVRVFRKYVAVRSRGKREMMMMKNVNLSALKTLADLACRDVRIEGDGLKNMVQHVAQAATSPQVKGDEEEKEEEKEEEGSS